MRSKISAIIIDPLYLQHDYSQVKANNGGEYEEKYFDLKIMDSGKNILETLYDFNGYDSIITIGDKSLWEELSDMPYYIRKKWCHFNDFIPSLIASSIVSTFQLNLNRKEDKPSLFSFFTCTYMTEKFKLKRLYNSICAQTYKEWNWFIIDDSDDDSVEKIINSFKDPRITIIKNSTKHGNIGFNKHTIAMMCDGDYLAEVDHDDELTNDCLEYINRAFNTYPDTDFVYSNAMEYVDETDKCIIYAKGWGWGEGITKTEVVNGKKYTFSESPCINPFSIRTIYAQPNHVRCWKKDFYHKIGGHSMELSVLDDDDIIIRSFLNGKITKVNKVLYIQHEGSKKRGESKDNTQSVRFGEIQRSVWYIKNAYDLDIHNRILELGFTDYAWDEEHKASILWKEHEPGKEIMCNVLEP